MSEFVESDERHLFKDTEFGIHKSFREFEKSLEKLMDEKFSNADAIRSLEDNHQLALYLWNLPKFQTIEELYKWLCKENFEKSLEKLKEKEENTKEIKKAERCKNCISWVREECVTGFEKGKCDKKPKSEYKRANQIACKKFKRRIVKF